MATTSPTPTLEAPTQGGTSKLALIPLLLAILAAIVISVLLLGGIGYYLIRSGKLALPAARTTPVAVAKPEPEKTSSHMVELEPMVVNLADAGGKAYLRIAVTLKVADPEQPKGVKPAEEKPKEGNGAAKPDVALRDTVLDVLGRQSAEALLTADGKPLLKEALKTALAKRNNDIPVLDIYFGEFLVQR